MHTSLRLLEGVSLVKRSCNGIRKDLLVTEEIAESSDLRATPFEFELEQERMQFQTRGVNRTTRAELA
jgi:hypothetical protein